MCVYTLKKHIYVYICIRTNIHTWIYVHTYINIHIYLFILNIRILGEAGLATVITWQWRGGLPFVGSNPTLVRGGPHPATPNFPLRHPTCHPLETIRPLIELGWGV